jgi:SAM-dependent methyltransferase
VTAAPEWLVVAERAAISPGTRVLDVGCGTGGFCAFATARGAFVAGVDLDPDRVAAARARVPAGDFTVDPMEQLPWTDGAFDVVTGFNAFQYALDVPAALAEAARVSRGCVAVCKYGDARENEFFAFLATLHPDRFDMATLPRTDDVDRALERYEIRDHGVIATELAFADDAALTRAVDHPGAIVAAAGRRRPDGSYRFAQQLKYRIIDALS